MHWFFNRFQGITLWYGSQSLVSLVWHFYPSVLYFSPISGRADKYEKFRSFDVHHLEIIIMVVAGIGFYRRIQSFDGCFVFNGHTISFFGPVGIMIPLEEEDNTGKCLR